MLLSMMVYATLASALLAGAAWALERGGLRFGAATRWIWVAALLGSVIPVVVGLSRPDGRAAAPAIRAPGDGSWAEVTSSRPLPVPTIRLEVPAWPDSWIAVGWVSLTLVCTLVVGTGVLRLRRDRERWSAAVLDGRAVLVSEAVGPAVVGLRHPRIVVPTWALEMAPTDRELLMRHEEEHLRAGDSRLFAAAMALVALLPWNLPLWWMAARLKLALEVDCDGRVLRRDPRVRPYASLLIGLAEREAGTRVAALAFIESMPFLERRIRAMTDPRSPTRTRVIAWSACAALLVVAACRVDQPAITAPESGNDAIEAFDVESESPSPFIAQVRFDDGAVVGVLRDRASGQPLEDVEVFLPGRGIGARTNAAGRFLLLNVPQGDTQTILARHPQSGVFRIARVHVSDPPGDRDGDLPGILQAPSGTVGVVVGTVRDAVADAPLMAATVWIDGTGIGARTNASGRYLLLNVPVGEHTLVVERDGYEAVRRTVDVRAERRSTAVDVGLRRR